MPKKLTYLDPGALRAIRDTASKDNVALLAVVAHRLPHFPDNALEK